MTGRVGSALAAAVGAAPDLELVSAVSRRAAGTSVAGVPVSATVAEALERAPVDVLVDYTRADVALAHALAALDRGARVVVGTSGLTAEDDARLDEAARRLGLAVFVAGNFAVTAVLLARFAELAARELAAWEIIDYGKPDKIDAPSGTARELAGRLAAVRAPARPIALTEVVGEPAARGADIAGTQVHSVRLPGHLSAVEVVFGAAGQRLTLRHEAIDAGAPYVDGTLLAIRRVGGLSGLVRGLDQLLVSAAAR